MNKVTSNRPDCSSLIRKDLDTSIGQRPPPGTYTKEPSENTAELSPAYKLSDCGTTEPKYLRTSSGCSRSASEIEQKITPALASSALKVVTTETLSNTASTATRAPFTPAKISRSFSGMPSFS